MTTGGSPVMRAATCFRCFRQWFCLDDSIITHAARAIGTAKEEHQHHYGTRNQSSFRFLQSMPSIHNYTALKSWSLKQAHKSVYYMSKKLQI